AERNGRVGDERTPDEIGAVVDRYPSHTERPADEPEREEDGLRSEAGRLDDADQTDDDAEPEGEDAEVHPTTGERGARREHEATDARDREVEAQDRGHHPGGRHAAERPVRSRLDRPPDGTDGEATGQSAD